MLLKQNKNTSHDVLKMLLCSIRLIEKKNEQLLCRIKATSCSKVATLL